MTKRRGSSSMFPSTLKAALLDTTEGEYSIVPAYSITPRLTRSEGERVRYAWKEGEEKECVVIAVDRRWEFLEASIEFDHRATSSHRPSISNGLLLPFPEEVDSREERDKRLKERTAQLVEPRLKKEEVPHGRVKRKRTREEEEAGPSGGGEDSSPEWNPLTHSFDEVSSPSSKETEEGLVDTRDTEIAELKKKAAVDGEDRLAMEHLLSGQERREEELVKEVAYLKQKLIDSICTAEEGEKGEVARLNEELLALRSALKLRTTIFEHVVGKIRKMDDDEVEDETRSFQLKQILKDCSRMEQGGKWAVNKVGEVSSHDDLNLLVESLGREEEIEKLREENKSLRMDRDILQYGKERAERQRDTAEADARAKGILIRGLVGDSAPHEAVSFTRDSGRRSLGSRLPSLPSTLRPSLNTSF